jgi:hypothetical protein
MFEELMDTPRTRAQPSYSGSYVAATDHEPIDAVAIHMDELGLTNFDPFRVVAPFLFCLSHRLASTTLVRACCFAQSHHGYVDL